MKKLIIKTPHSKYPVWIGAGILEKTATSVVKDLKPSRIFIITDSRLRAQTHSLAKSLERSGYGCSVISLQVSESLKDLNRVYPLYGRLLKEGADRGSLIMALGGGVIGDLAGFIAGTYQRGIPWIGIPSTLLAQVDSCIGGKTGVNHEIGKNLIGVFHQPSAVICDVQLLESLSRRDQVSGLGEIIKTALILDPRFFMEVVRNWKLILKTPTSSSSSNLWISWIHRSLKLKAQIVEKDVYDATGIRNILNFGHTLGHALEAETDYRVFRHGEAVIYGMRVACFLSHLRGHLSTHEFEKIDSFLASLPVPKIPSGLSTTRCIRRVQWDKKARKKKPLFVLLHKVGDTIQDTEVTEAEMMKAFEWIKSQPR